MLGKKSLVVLGAIMLALSLFLGIVACAEEEGTTTTAGGPETTAPAAGEAQTLKIGAIMPLTGPLSIPSLAFTRGWEMYADVVNEAGGVRIGDAVYTIEFIVEDSKLSAEGAGTAATKLVNQDKVQFIIGAMHEMEAAAIYQVTQPAGVLYALANINVPGHPSDVAADKELLVRLNVSPDENHVIDLDYILENYPEAKKLAIAAPIQDYQTMIDRLTQEATERGLEVILVQDWTLGTTDFVPIMTNVVAAKPDIVWGMNSGQANDQLRAARQLGFEGVFVSNCPLGADVFLVTVQDPVWLTDVIVNSLDVIHPTSDVQALMEHWGAKWPNDPFVSDAVTAYDMPWILIQGMQEAGSIDPAAVMAALETMTSPGDIQTSQGAGYMGGMERFGVNRVIHRPYPMTIIMNGELEFIGFVEPATE